MPGTPNDTQVVLDQNQPEVLVAVKTAMLPHATTRRLPAHLTLRQSLDEIRGTPPKDDTARRVQQELARETSRPGFQYLVLGPTGQLVRVPPETRLADIALPKEIRTSRGIETVPAAAIEIQGYASVGGRHAPLPLRN